MAKEKQGKEQEVVPENGDKEPEELEKTTGFKPGKPLPEHGWTRAFETPGQQNNIRYVVEAGEGTRDIMMRSYLPAKKTEAYRLLLGVLTIIRKCNKFHDEEGKEEMLNYLALLVSQEGQGRKDLVVSLVGGYFGDKELAQDTEGLTAKLRKIALGK